MCIIIHKPANVSMPAIETLENCWHSNPDGAGFAFKDSSTKRLAYAKGFLTFGSFNQALQDLAKIYNLQDLDLVMHFRIGTSGGISPEKCHPFPICKTFPEMERLSGNADALLFHNGVVGAGCKTHSDTEIFIRDILTPVLHNKALLREALDIRSQRFVLMSDGDTPTIRVGEFIHDQGCYFSNYSYEYNFLSYGTTEEDIKYDIFSMIEELAITAESARLSPQLSSRIAELYELALLPETEGGLL